MTCEQCKSAGPGCGPADPVATSASGKAPCVVCGTPTGVRLPCGAARTFICLGGPGHLEPTGYLRRAEVTVTDAHGTRTLTIGPDGWVQCPNHGPESMCPDCAHGGPYAAPAPRCPDCSTNHEGRCYSPTGPRPALQWVRAGKAQAGRRGKPAGTLQPRLADELTGRGLTPAEVARGVELWNQHMRGIAYGGGHHTALAILTGTLRHRAIPELPAPTAGALAPLEAPGASVWVRRSWNVYGGHSPQAGPSSDLAAWDVNAMYLSAAAIELGTGAPDELDWPADSVLHLPGFVQVSSLEGAPWSIGDHWTEGQWMPTPLAAYLRDRGAAFLMPRALVWPEHRRWLDPHVNLLRRARAALVEDDSQVAVELLAVVKDVYTRMFGGLLASTEYNHSHTLRPDWRSIIVATAQARMFRNLDKVNLGTGYALVGVHVDAAWFVLPAGWAQPPGLIVSAQPGKFKPAGRTSWTPELRAAWQDGGHEPLWSALNLAAKPELRAAWQDGGHEPLWSALDLAAKAEREAAG
jgi:hypothetical protein